MLDGKFTIIIPTRGITNNQDLKNCLEGLSKQEGVHSEEIIIINDGGESVNKIQNYPNLAIKIINLDKSEGPESARNHGVTKSTREFIIFIDDDSIPIEDWLKNFKLAWKSNLDKAGIGGIINSHINDTEISKVNAIIFNSVIELRGGMNKPQFVNTCNGSFKKEKLTSINGFDKTFRHLPGADTDLSLRLIKSGEKLHIDKKITVYHSQGIPLSKFLKKYFFYGVSSYLIGKKHPYREKISINSFLKMLKETNYEGYLIHNLYQKFLIILAQTATVIGYLFGFFKIIGKEKIKD